MTNVVKDRFYVRGSVVPFEEDLRHEFKGHRTITLQDRLPVGVKPHHSGSPGGLVNTRQQWSKYICGMLNSGLGGVLYGGIFDNGMVNGFMMSSYQRVHVALQLQEVLQRFEPRVPTELVSVQFVPIKEPFDKGILVEDEELLVSERFSSLAHKIRSYQRCWCDQEASASVMRCLLLPCYVIEVLVQGQQEMVFAAEDGGIYVRRQASTDWLEGRPEEWGWRKEGDAVGIVKKYCEH